MPENATKTDQVRYLKIQSVDADGNPLTTVDGTLIGGTATLTKSATSDEIVMVCTDQDGYVERCRLIPLDG
jgi:hypothetical protein